MTLPRISDRASFLITVAAFLAFMVGIVLVDSYFEAKTFTRITGTHVTWWEAVWVEFRVDCRNPNPRGAP